MMRAAHPADGGRPGPPSHQRRVLEADPRTCRRRPVGRRRIPPRARRHPGPRPLSDRRDRLTTCRHERSRQLVAPLAGPSVSAHSRNSARLEKVPSASRRIRWQILASKSIAATVAISWSFLSRRRAKKMRLVVRSSAFRDELGCFAGRSVPNVFAKGLDGTPVRRRGRRHRGYCRSTLSH